jgi:hypothetical protein
VRETRRASDAIALAAAAVVLVLFAACVVLTILTRDMHATFGGALPVAGLLFAALGLLVARRRPGNPMGWLLVGCCGVTLLITAAGLYAVLDYRIDHGSLPGGRAVVFAESFAFLAAVLCGLAIFLFPDGTLPSRRWRWMLWAYLAASAAFMANQFIGYSTAAPVGPAPGGPPVQPGQVRRGPDGGRVRRAPERHRCTRRSPR